MKYHIVLTPLPAEPGEPPPIVRLRVLLKRALRSYRLRCCESWQEDDQGQPIPLPEPTEELT